MYPGHLSDVSAVYVDRMAYEQEMCASIYSPLQPLCSSSMAGGTTGSLQTVTASACGDTKGCEIDAERHGETAFPGPTSSLTIVETNDLSVPAGNTEVMGSTVHRTDHLIGHVGSMNMSGILPARFVIFGGTFSSCNFS